MESLKIVLFSVAAAIAYGILQDQITARVCVEYFTIGHPPVFATNEPTLLAIGWGVLATWWVGVLLGMPLAWVARCGSKPKLVAHDLVKPLAVLMACVGMSALLAGVLGFLAARSNVVWLLEPLASRVPANVHAAFLADLWAHAGAYLSGLVGAIVVYWWAWKRRRMLHSQVMSPFCL